MSKRRRDPEATRFARTQRSTSNEFAETVWQMLRNRRCCDEKFRREHGIAPYTVDFCCVSLKLIVEVDGQEHFSEAGVERDRIRDQFLQDLGYEVLRIAGYDVLRDPQSVLQRLRSAVENRRHP